MHFFFQLILTKNVDLKFCKIIFIFNISKFVLVENLIQLLQITYIVFWLYDLSTNTQIVKLSMGEFYSYLLCKRKKNKNKIEDNLIIILSK